MAVVASSQPVTLHGEAKRAARAFRKRSVADRRASKQAERLERKQAKEMRKAEAAAAAALAASTPPAALTTGEAIPAHLRRPRGRGGGGNIRSRPSKASLLEWAGTLSHLGKFAGISTSRRAGGSASFKQMLLSLVTAAGGSTKPSDLRAHRHLPSDVNRAASAICNEAATGATCECHSAGAVSLARVLREFLVASCQAGLSRVNIVCGLGSHGGNGTIRHLVPGLLDADPLVRRFELAPNFAAVYVDLVVA
jgi:DNA-nicking Smr family endonuclease